MSTEAWAIALQVIGIVIAVLLVLVPVVWRASRRLDRQDAMLSALQQTQVEQAEAMRLQAAAMEDVRVEQARQFGGNSGGIREAVNRIADTSAQTAEAIAELRGEFRQHVREGDRPAPRSRTQR